ncbi:MAG: LytTR family DNA-binding domain-containing protein [Bacteroidota bacterium]|nr:DNA-binding response regulator [Odoribacter sp.]MDP3643376.1 LytTR family DNA-binding domain-containing protein [Bacteroidota bacterium]
MNCIIIEDEPAAQSILEHYIELCLGLTRAGTFRDVFLAQAFLDNNVINLMFLDINLPEMSGVSFLRSLVRPPLVIFTTAYPQYAVDGFDLEAVDFLLKPFSFERFCKAVNKAREKFNVRAQPVLPNKLSVKSGKRIYQISPEDILFIETCGDYVTVYCSDKKLMVHGTLKSWEEKLKGSNFLKVHRTIMINLSKIDHLEGNMLRIGDHKLPVSEQFKEQLLKQMG